MINPKHVYAGAVAASLWVMSGSAFAGTLDFTTYIDTVAGEKAVQGPFTLATDDLINYEIRAQGTTAVGGNVPGLPLTDAGFNTVPQAYFDGGNAGIGVCKVVNSSQQCNPASDDNVTGAVGSTGAEILSIAFDEKNTTADKSVVISDIIFRNDGHNLNFPANALIDVSLDGTNWNPYALEPGIPNGGTGTGLLLSASFALAVNQYIHFRFNNQQFYLSKLDIISREFDVPVPAALPLLATGLGALGFMGWRRKRKAEALSA